MLKLNKETKILLIEILKAGEISKNQSDKLIDMLSVKQPYMILPDGTKIRI